MYKKNISVFMIVLIVGIPFYISSVFAQTIPLADPAESCISRNEETSAIVDFLDSGPIKTLEAAASALYFTCTAWAVTEAAFDLQTALTGFCSDATCKLGTCTNPIGASVCGFNDVLHTARKAITGVMAPLCSLATCALCNKDINKIDQSEYSPGKLLGKSEVVTASTQEKLGKQIEHFALSPYENIYVAIGCLCPVGILFNLRKLKTIYQTHNCCVQEACKQGISVESCDRQFSEATCMYWEGSIYKAFVNILISFAAEFIVEQIGEEVLEQLSGSALAATLWSLFKAYLTIQELQTSWQWIGQTFSEPVCEDLDFDIGSQPSEPQTCELVQVDLNDDGIIDRLDSRCT